MAPAPKVSVVIPTYNRRRLLAEALDSVWAQTFTDYEVIVVDDGSTDDTLAYLETVQEPRLRFLSEPHRGISPTANAGLRAARGEFVARLDSDDLWTPGMLAAELSALEARPDAGFVYARMRCIDELGRPTDRVFGQPPRFPDQLLKSLVWEDCTTHCTVIARRELVEEIGGYDEDLPANEDWDLMLRMAARRPYVFVDRVTAFYRWHAGNSTTDAHAPLFEEALRTRRRVLDRVFAQPDVPPEVQAIRAAAYSNIGLEAGLRYAAARDFEAARRAFRRALGESDRKVSTAARITWFLFFRRALARVPGGLRLIQFLSRRRRRDSRPGVGSAD